MAKNNKTQASEAKRAEQIKRQPTCYTFNFKDTPIEKYADTLNLLFRDPDFSELVAKRNKLVETAGRIRPNSAEMGNLIKQIQQRDRKLADLLYAVIVQSNIRSEVTYDFLTFGSLLKYYVDYSKEGMQERVDKLSANLDKMTFLSDILEGLLTDIKGDMLQIFGSNIEFNQFQGVQQTLQQLRGFFKSAVPERNDDGNKVTQLYEEYTDSIKEYMDKRMKTYSEKYHKLKPRVHTHTSQQMIEAINIFFDVDHQFDKTYIAHTENGGSYIDAIRLIYNLTQSQTQKLDKVMESASNKVDMVKDPMNYCFRVTDAIMLYYREHNKREQKKQ